MILGFTITFVLLAGLVIWMNMETHWAKAFWVVVLIVGMVLINRWERMFVPLGIVVLLATYQSFRYMGDEEENEPVDSD